MGLMRDYFEVAYNVPWSSMVFDVVKRPRFVPDARGVPYGTVRAFYEHFIKYAPEWGQGAVWLGFGFYSASVKKFDEALKILEEVEAKYADNPIVSQYFPSIRGYCEAAAASGNPEEPKGRRLIGFR